jgi:hypothetical protein
MKQFKITLTLLVIAVSLSVVATGYILIGLYGLLGALGYFLYTLANHEEDLKRGNSTYDEGLMAFHRQERHKKIIRRNRMIANQANNNRQQQTLETHQYVPAIATGALTSAVVVNTSFDDDLFFAPDGPTIEPDLTDDIDTLDTHINPATGEPMIGGLGGVDTSGNPFGVDLDHSNVDSHTGSDVFESAAFDDSGYSIDTSWDSSYDDSF